MVNHFSIKGKNGWVRIVEAVIAILIVAGFVIFIYISRGGSVGKAEQIYNIERGVLEEISGNSVAREKILEEPPDKVFIANFISTRLNKYQLDFNISICAPDSACGLEVWPDTNEVYVEEALISSTLSEYNPKKLKLFVWEK